MASSALSSAVSSFMQGYSFIDDIRSRQRREDLLAESLAEEREQRRFARQQAEARGTRQAQSHAAALADRQSKIERDNRERAARAAIAQGGDASAFADTEFGAAELIRQGREDEIVSAARSIQGLGTPAPTSSLSGLSQQAAQQAAGAAQQQPPTATQSPPTDPAGGESLLAPNRGRGSLETVEFEDLSPFDEEFQQTGLAGQIGDALFSRTGRNIAETTRGVSAAAANVVNSFTGSPPTASGARVAAGLTGTLAVPEAFVTEEEFALLEDPQEIEAARASNAELIASMKQRASNPEASRVSRLSDASRELTENAQRAEFAVNERYSEFVDPNVESNLRKLAVEQPDLAVTQYFEDRATLEGANPELRKVIDRQMQPVLTAYEQQLQSEVAEAPIGTPDRKRAFSRLRNVQASAKQIYEDYKPSQAAGVNSRGMPVGNQELSGRVTEEIESPDRPRPTTPLPAPQINAAMTAASRVRPNSRLTESQVRSVVRLRDAGLMTPGDAQSLLLTGQLPGSSLAVKFREFDGDLWATDERGNIKLVKTGRNSGRKGAEVEPNQISTRALDDIEVGLRAVMPEADDSYVSAATNLLLNNTDFLQQRFDLRNQQSNIELGRVLGQSIFLNAAENHRRDNNWIPFDGFFDAPSAQEILTSPEIRNELAGRFDIMLQNIPDLRETGIPPQFDIGAARAFLQSGDLGPRQQQIGAEGSDEDVFLELYRLDQLTPEE